MSDLPRISSVVESVQEAMSIKYNTLVYEMRAQGKEVIVLSLGEAFFDIPFYSMEAMPIPGSYHYSHSRGISELRKVLCDYYASDFGVEVDADSEILVTAGSKAAIYMSLLSVLDEGSEVLIPEPAWVSYSEQVRLCRGVPVGIPMGVPVRDYGRYVTDRTRVLIINNPHNPTGYIYSRKELEFLDSFARERSLWLMSDEAYSDFTRPGEFVSLGAIDRAKRNTVIFNSVSKNFGLSGWRLGYVIANAGLIRQILKVNQHLITCPATLLEHYVVRYYDSIKSATHGQISQVLDLRARAREWLKEYSLDLERGDGTFYFFVSIAPSRLGSEDFCMRLLQDHGVCVVPGVGYGASCDRHVRVSIGTASQEDIRRGFKAIRELIDRTL